MTGAGPSTRTATNLLRGREEGERELHDSADYERVVPWFEYGCVCQLALVTTRKPLSSAQLQLGLEVWRALANPDPRSLATTVHQRPQRMRRLRMGSDGEG